MGKGEILATSNFSFSQSVFKRLVLQTLKNQGMFGKGLNNYKTRTKFQRLGLACEYSATAKINTHLSLRELLGQKLEKKKK